MRSVHVPLLLGRPREARGERPRSSRAARARGSPGAARRRCRPRAGRCPALRPIDGSESQRKSPSAAPSRGAELREHVARASRSGARARARGRARPRAASAAATRRAGSTRARSAARAPRSSRTCRPSPRAATPGRSTVACARDRRRRSYACATSTSSAARAPPRRAASGTSVPTAHSALTLPAVDRRGELARTAAARARAPAATSSSPLRFGFSSARFRKSSCQPSAAAAHEDLGDAERLLRDGRGGEQVLERRDRREEHRERSRRACGAQRRRGALRRPRARPSGRRLRRRAPRARASDARRAFRYLYETPAVVAHPLLVDGLVLARAVAVGRVVQVVEERVAAARAAGADASAPSS